MSVLKEKQKQRLTIHEQMIEMVKKADGENRSLTPEEVEKYSRMKADKEALTADINRREELEAEERALSAPKNTPPNPNPGVVDPSNPTASLSKEERAEKENKAFTAWIRFGFEGLNAEQRTLMSQRRAHMDSAGLPPELRQQAVSPGTAGGYMIPQGFSGELETMLKLFGGVRKVARVIPTPDGRDIPWPTVDDTANKGEIISENSTYHEQDLVFAQKILKAWKYSSKMVPVSVELLQDSFFNIDAMLAELLSIRIGRATNYDMTNGAANNAAGPEGVINANLGASGTLSYDTILDLVHSVDPLYRPNGRFMFNDETLKVIRQLTDGVSRPILFPYAQAGMSSAPPESLVGYPYVINNDMPLAGTSGNVTLLFGDFSKYIVRDARDVTIVRLQERYAELGQVAFLAFSRTDGRYINKNAVKSFVTFV